jgi:hypothetical protein
LLQFGYPTLDGRSDPTRAQFVRLFSLVGLRVFQSFVSSALYDSHSGTHVEITSSVSNLVREISFTLSLAKLSAMACHLTIEVSL